MANAEEAERRLEIAVMALQRIPQILYGLGLNDPRQAAVAQKAIDTARQALAEVNENG
jgi:hypothetical protein